MLNANQPFKQFVFLLQKWECCYGGDLKKQSIEDLLLKVSKQNVKVGRYFVTMISVMYLMATILLCNLFEPESDG